MMHFLSSAWVWVITSFKPTSLYRIPAACFYFFAFRTLSAPGMPRQSTPTQGKSVTFGVTRTFLAVASPVSSITWLIAP
jgi:hypothetical protein